MCVYVRVRVCMRVCMSVCVCVCVCVNFDVTLIDYPVLRRYIVCFWHVRFYKIKQCKRNTLQHTETHCNILPRTATHCWTLLHTATHCNTLHTHCNTLSYPSAEITKTVNDRHHYTLQHTATHCTHTATLPIPQRRDHTDSQ